MEEGEREHLLISDGVDKKREKKETGKWYGTFPVTHGNYSLRRQYYVVLHQIRFHISVFLLLTPLISPQQLEAAVKAELFFFL